MRQGKPQLYGTNTAMTSFTWWKMLNGSTKAGPRQDQGPHADYDALMRGQLPSSRAVITGDTELDVLRNAHAMLRHLHGRRIIGDKELCGPANSRSAPSIAALARCAP